MPKKNSKSAALHAKMGKKEQGYVQGGKGATAAAYRKSMLAGAKFDAAHESSPEMRKVHESHVKKYSK